MTQLLQKASERNSFPEQHDAPGEHSLGNDTTCEADYIGARRKEGTAREVNREKLAGQFCFSFMSELTLGREMRPKEPKANSTRNRARVQSPN